MGKIRLKFPFLILVMFCKLIKLLSVMSYVILQIRALDLIKAMLRKHSLLFMTAELSITQKNLAKWWSRICLKAQSQKYCGIFSLKLHLRNIRPAMLLPTYILFSRQKIHKIESLWKNTLLSHFKII